MICFLKARSNRNSPDATVKKKLHDSQKLQERGKQVKLHLYFGALKHVFPKGFILGSIGRKKSECEALTREFWALEKDLAQ